MSPGKRDAQVNQIVGEWPDCKQHETPGGRLPRGFVVSGQVSGLAAYADHWAVTFIGEDNPDCMVMAETFDDDLAMIDTNDFGMAQTHAAGLPDGLARLAEAIIPATVTASRAAPTAVATVIADDHATTRATD